MNELIYGYSQKEFAMIEQLSPYWSDLIKKGKIDSIMPPDLLKLVAMDCFVEKKEGKAVDSLRRCVKACRDCKPYRLTPEYEALIDLGVKKQLYEVFEDSSNGKCPICGKELGYCAAGEYCNGDDRCGYVDGFVWLTLEQAKTLKEKLGWGTPEQRRAYWKNCGLED